jgi:2-keto-4-pentenoate hydratase/2-oxohepta-3-ene-1,7-dioic acid hydratase in catechol pathway
MRIISFSTQDTDWKSPRMGIILYADGHDIGERLDCEKLFEPADRPRDPLAWFDMGDRWFQAARDTARQLERDANARAQARDKGWLVPRQDAYWHAPVPRPGKIVCIGLNYRDHAAESGLAVPEKPVVFSKFSSCVIAPGEEVVIPTTSEKVDYEAELAVVIGRHAKHVKASDAYDYVLGYTAFNDVTARDFQFGDGQWQRGKSCDTFAPMGPTDRHDGRDSRSAYATDFAQAQRQHDAGLEHQSVDLWYSAAHRVHHGQHNARARATSSRRVRRRASASLASRRCFSSRAT